MKEKISSMFALCQEMMEYDEVKKLVDLIVDGESEVVFTGVGKNWYICEKVHKTFTSIGLKSQTLDPVHALHGDLGMLNKKNQIIIFLSKSGTTKELVDLLAYLHDGRRRGIINSTFVSFSLNNEINDPRYDLIIKPKSEIKIHEFDDRDLVPTLSINIMQMILDYVGTQVFDMKPWLQHRYKFNHPGGNIGRILSGEK